MALAMSGLDYDRAPVALRERLREIDGGEEEDASQY